MWKIISDFPNYSVNEIGNVKNNRTGKILSQNKASGYYKVILWTKKNNFKKGFSKSVHRLVAKAFIPNPNNYPVVNHKNEIKTDNRVDNLEWCTYKYNNNYGTKRKRQSKSAYKRPIIAIDIQTKKVFHFNSMTDASKELQIDLSTINKIVLNKPHYRTFKGYIFIEKSKFKPKLVSKYIKNRVNIHSVYRTPIIGYKIKSPNSKFRYKSLSEASKLTKVTKSQISQVINHKVDQAKGWKFHRIK